MTFSMAVYGQALDNESPDPTKADGVWLTDPHNVDSQAVVAFVMNVKKTGVVAVSTADLVVTQSLLDGLVVEARCKQLDSGGRDSFLVYCEPGTRATPEALRRSELALNEFAKELERDLSRQDFFGILKKSDLKLSRNRRVFFAATCVIMTVSAIISIFIIS